jgi:hypothetical protein
MRPEGVRNDTGVQRAVSNSHVIGLQCRSPPSPELLQLRDKQPCLTIIPHNLARGSKSFSKKKQPSSGAFSDMLRHEIVWRRCAMTAWTPRSFPRLSAILLVVLCAQSSVLARGGGFPHNEPWSSERIDHLPPEVRNAVFRMCRVRPVAAQYFATYLDNARIIKLHFEHFHCDGPRTYRDADRCLHQEFARSDSHYRLARNYYGLCND